MAYLWGEYKDDIVSFGYTLLVWFFWAIVISICIYIIIFINAKFTEEKKGMLRELEEQEKKEMLQELKEQEERVLHKLYDEKIEALALLEAKNEQLAEDVKTSKYAVSGISIYDNDFLEQQPKVLQYINDAITQGRG